MKLQSQFSLALLPLLLITGGGVTWLAKKAVHKIVLEEVAGRAQGPLKDLAAASAAGFETKSEDQLLPLLSAALVREEAAYAIALDAEGHVLAHTNVLEKGKTYGDQPASDRASRGAPVVTEVSWQGKRVADVTWPVWQQLSATSQSGEDLILSAGQDPSERVRLGSLRLALPLDRALETENKITRQLAILLAIAWALILGLAFVLIRNILNPVARLVLATESLAQGDYTARVPIPSASEFAILASTFNRMIESLGQTTVSKDFLDMILTNMLDPLVVLKADSSVRMVNRAALELLGYGAGDLLEQPPTMIMTTAPQMIAAIRERGSVDDQEQQWKTKDGTAIPVLFSGSVFKDPQGTVLGWIFVAKDMREWQRREKELRQTEKLSAVGRLASGVAHEINNPLGVILGYAESALWDLKPEDPLQEPLKSIQRETMRCKNLVQDLLTFSRVSKTEQEPMQLNAAVKGAFSLVLAEARLGQVHVVQDLQEGLPAIRGNVNQLQQVIINLANNALDAMKQQGTLTVRTDQTTENGKRWVVLSISDTGSGIPADVLPRIFEPFFTTKSIGQGTGLGLGLVAEIVQKHSGTIDVQSKPGHTVFEIRFPAK